MMKQGALMILLYALVHFPFCDNLIDENLEVITLKRVVNPFVLIYKERSLKQIPVDSLS